MSTEMPRVERVGEGREGFIFIHICTGGQTRTTQLPRGPSGWEWTADGGITPSIQCMSCNTHGFWVGGDTPYWRPC
jgi:hypothetical protein